MLIHEFLNETISISGIDRLARARLRTDLQSMMAALWDVFREDDGEDDHNKYDDWYRRVSVGLPRASLIKRICKQASETLTSIVREDLLVQFPDGKIPIKKPDFDHYVPVDNVVVSVDDRDTSTDSMRHHSGGYFNEAGEGGSLLAKCFVDGGRVFRSACGMMQMVAFGEGDGEADMLKSISKVFVHEYTHLLQFIRGMSMTSNDLGYITAGGGRYGNRRSPQIDKISRLRYLSSAHEIDSFAADAASEIIEYGGDSHQKIRSALRDIAQGYDGSSSASTSRYSELNYDAMSGKFQEMGVSRSEVKTVWNRYLKLLYKKLWDYSSGRMGRTEISSYINKMPTDWIKAAEKGMSYAAAYISIQVARDVLDGKYKSREDAPTFLMFYFFGEEYAYDYEKGMQIDRAFNKLVDKAIDRENNFGR